MASVFVSFPSMPLLRIFALQETRTVSASFPFLRLIDQLFGV